LAAQLLADYAGHFLPEESGAWAILPRERLRNRFFNTVQELAACFESREAWEVAARCYRRALEIDPLLENFWYRLMLCHEQLAQPEDALAVYRRCREALFTGLRTHPSAEVEALQRALAQRTTRRIRSVNR